MQNINIVLTSVASAQRSNLNNFSAKIDFQSLKTDISTILEALSFDFFDAFIQYLTEIVQNRF